MPVTNPTTIVDAIVADLTTAGGLSPKRTRKYAPPVDIQPSHAPELAVWTERTEYKPLTGLLAGGAAAYERRHAVMVAWYVANRQGAETGGTGDPAIVQALEATVLGIVNRLAIYAGGVPTIGPQLVATVTSSSVRPWQGDIWEGLVELDVEEAA